MQPGVSPSGSFAGLIISTWRNRHLIARMIQREVVGRYKGSVLGLLWSLLNPLFMLVIYTFVFAVIFRSRWDVAGDVGRSGVAIILFTGMIVHTLFSEVVNQAPMLIIGNVNYVKRMVFPLEILPVVAMGSALFHTLVSLAVLLGAFALVSGSVHATVIALPVVLLPLILLTLGLAWFIASLGVFVRDVGQTVSIATTATLFLSAVFYPIGALPEQYQPWLRANPLAFIIEQARVVVVYGRWPQWSGLGICFVASLAVVVAGFAWFQRTRKGFADVL